MGRYPTHQTIQPRINSTPDIWNFQHTAISKKQCNCESPPLQSFQSQYYFPKQESIPVYTKPKSSRRKKQRERKREHTKITSSNEKILQNRIQPKISQLRNTIGFISDPDKTPTQNFNGAIQLISNTYFLVNIQQKTTPIHKLQPRIPALHNLCQDTPPPEGTRDLLGLGLKYCPASQLANPNIKDYVQNLAYRTRTKEYLLQATNSADRSMQYIPQLYVKLKGWYPLPPL
jgi:hypothetical protein